MAFERWNNEIAAAMDDATQRKLLAEIGSWRAQNLADIPGMREAAFAMSQLFHKLGDRDSSVREARSLLSLCQIAPEASGEEHGHVKAYLNGMGEKVRPLPEPPRDRSRRNERVREPREPRAPRETDVPGALQLAAAGDHGAAMAKLKGARGRGQLAVAWVRLSSALALEGDARDTELARLDRWLRQILGVNATKAAPAPEVIQPPTEADGALGILLGRRLPRRREARVRSMQRFLVENLDKADELAATALQDHHAQAGADVPAPWLVSFVALAMAEEGPKTTAVLATLKEAGSVAVLAYDEWAFTRAVSLIKAARPRFAGLRRGVLGRAAEPDDRRCWTLRLDNETRMIVLCPAADEPYPAETAALVAERLPNLCDRLIFVAPGAGNAPLREAAAKLSVLALDGDPSDVELLSAVDRVSPIPGARAPRPKSNEPREPKAAKQAKAAPPEPEGPSAVELTEAALVTDPLDEDALKSAVAGLHKLRDAFLSASRIWSPLPEDASVRLASLLAAADASAPDGLRVPEAVTLALRVASSQGGPTAAAIAEGPLAERFGGPGITDVVGVVAAASGAGWSLRRAFRGTTRRERRNNAALAELGGALDGLWRLGIEKEDKRGEIWFVAELPIEGRAAIPQLLMDDRPRVVVLPIDAELSSWYATLGADPAIGWMPGETDALHEGLANLGA